jgi:hypothetical protein
MIGALERNELSEAPARMTVAEYLTGKWLMHERGRVAKNV